MNTQKIINNIPWNRFNHFYDRSTDLRPYFQAILDGSADLSAYKYIIDRVEHQDGLCRISPWALKLYIALLEEDKSNKNELLNSISVVYLAANFQNQFHQKIEQYKPSKKMLEKYETVKSKLFDDENDADFWLVYKSLHRSFINTIVMDYLTHFRYLLESFCSSADPETAKRAQALIESINNPPQYLD